VEARWNLVVEPQTGHRPGEAAWRLVFSLLRHSFQARVPADADPSKGPVERKSLALESGHLGGNWTAEKGGYQELPTAAFSSFEGGKATASRLFNAEDAADWKAFHQSGDARKLETRPQGGNACGRSRTVPPGWLGKKCAAKKISRGIFPPPANDGMKRDTVPG
jgi:hypothetical protein